MLSGSRRESRSFQEGKESDMMDLDEKYKLAADTFSRSLDLADSVSEALIVARAFGNRVKAAMDEEKDDATAQENGFHLLAQVDGAMAQAAQGLGSLTQSACQSLNVMLILEKMRQGAAVIAFSDTRPTGKGN